jgi:type II secretory pathway component PulK
MMRRVLKNDHGVALIIVLLITALLIALVFEFAYSTRVSLRAAVNFRDSQRAYFLARSGINYCMKYKGLTDMVPQGTWTVVQVGDTAVMIKWEDEAGKINIKNITATKAPAYARVAQLFSDRGVSPDILAKIVDSSNPRIQLVTELHRYMTDDDYDKVAPFLTANSNPVDVININTASETVLRSALPNNSSAVNDIVSRRQEQHLTDLSGLGGNFTSEITGMKIYSDVTVGGYNKRIITITNSTASDSWTLL